MNKIRFTLSAALIMLISITSGIGCIISSKDNTSPYGDNMSFKHTQPGVYSEVFISVNGTPGDTVDLTLNGPGVIEKPSDKKATIGPDGKATISWRINKLGTYMAHGTYSKKNGPEGAEIQDTIVVK